MQTGVTRWSGTAAPTEESLRRLMRAEGLQPCLWANGPFDRYAPHDHDYDKVIYVVRGKVTFGLPKESLQIELNAGDRLDLRAGTMHDATVGPEGVVCLEAHGR